MYNNLIKKGYSLIVKDEYEVNDSIFYEITIKFQSEEVGLYIFQEFLPSEETRNHKAGDLIATEAETQEDHRRKGLATSAYIFIEEYTGKKIQDNFPARTQDGTAFWNQQDRPFGN